MLFDEICLHNFGVFKDRQTASLSPPNKQKPIILFGGVNGAGKTTLLDALQLVLYGKLAHCSNRGNLSYEEFLRRSIHKATNPKEGASLELQFRHVINGKEDTYRISRLWVENGKDIRESVEVIKNGKPDRVLTEAWIEYIEEYIPLQISPLFFFDGEKIEQIADLANSAQVISTAFHSLLGLDIVDQLSNDLVVLERRKRTSLKTESERNQIEQARIELQRLGEHRSDIAQAQAAAQNDLELLQKKLHQIEVRFQKEGGKLFEDRNAIESQKTDLDKNLHSVYEEIRELAAGPTPFLMIPDLLSSIEKQYLAEETSLQVNKLNDTLDKRDQQLLELAARSHVASDILEILKQFLSEDRKHRVDASRIECYLNLGSEAGKILQNLIANVLPEVKSCSFSLLDKEQELRSSLDDLDRKLAAMPDQDLINQIIEERDKTKREVEHIQIKIKALRDEVERLDREQKQKHDWMVSQIEKVVGSDFEREDIGRILHYSQKSREALKLFRTRIIKHHVDRVCLLILDSFNQLIRKRNLITELKIDPESFMLHLLGGDGKVLPTDRLSAGERQLLAVSILWGLARASGRSLPAAIDTPLGRLDSSHRNHLVERYFPHASHQVLLFSTDEEIDQTYYEKLKPFIGRTYLLEFDNSTSSTQIQRGYFG